jgi:hypothetical protein
MAGAARAKSEGGFFLILTDPSTVLVHGNFAVLFPTLKVR